LSELRRELRARLDQGLAVLPDKPEETVEATLAALWLAAHGTALSAEAAAMRDLPTLDAAQEARVRELVERRLAGKPLAHLTGRQRFMGLELEADPAALIPRRETEVLANAAIGLLAENASATALEVIDVCTGSGNVALAIAAHEPRARVHAADLSPEAVALARRNAALVGLADRVTFESGDLLAPYDATRFHDALDLLSCNPPYISSAKVDTMPHEISRHEPRLAFDGGPLGIRVLNRLIQEAPRFLRAGGWLVFEVGLGQARGVRKRLEQLGRFDAIREYRDAAGEVRALAARRGA
jgi:release factor glutamine methyltransferase